MTPSVDIPYQEASVTLLEAMALSEEMMAMGSIAIVVTEEGTHVMHSDSMDSLAIANICGALAQHHYMAVQEAQHAEQ